MKCQPTYTFECISQSQRDHQHQWQLRDNRFVQFSKISATEWSVHTPLADYTDEVMLLKQAGIELSQPTTTTLKDLAGAVASVIGCSPQLQRGSNPHGFHTRYRVGDTGFQVVNRRPVMQEPWALFTDSSVKKSVREQLTIQSVKQSVGKKSWETRRDAVESLQEAFAKELVQQQQQPVRAWIKAHSNLNAYINKFA